MAVELAERELAVGDRPGQQVRLNRRARRGELVAAAALSLAGALFFAIGVTGLGAWRLLLVWPVTLALAGAGALVVAGAARVRGAKSSPRATRSVVVALAGLAAGVVAGPLVAGSAAGDAQDAQAAWRAASSQTHLAAAACAAEAVQAVPEEADPVPGEVIRPDLTAQAGRCLEARLPWRTVCSSGECQVAAPGMPGGAGLAVYLPGFLDEALAAQGLGPWNRAPRAGWGLPGAPWVQPGGTGFPVGVAA